MLWGLLGGASQSHSLGSRAATVFVSHCHPGEGSRTNRTPPHCCRVRLLCDTSMSHPQLFLALLELGRAPGFVPQLGRGQFRPHCQGLMLCVGGGDFGSEHHCCLLAGFCPVPLPSVLMPCPTYPFIPVPFALHPCTYLPFSLVPLTSQPWTHHSPSLSCHPPFLSHLLIILIILNILHLWHTHCPSLFPLPSILILLFPEASQQQTGGSGSVSFVPVPVWEHWGLPVTGETGTGQWECWGAWRFAGGHWAEDTALLLSLSASPSLALCLSFPSL